MEAVQVYCRLKPQADDERPACVECGDDSVSVSGRSLAFGFSRVLGPHATQEDVFETCGRAPCASVLEGINGAVLAFGQTGSGKTHTIHGVEAAPGLVPRIMGELFAQVGKHMAEDSPFSFEVRLSYVEVYNEHIYDLLLRCSECGGLTDEPHSVAKNKYVYSCGHSLCAACSVASYNRPCGRDEAEADRANEGYCHGCKTWQRRWRRTCTAGLNVSELPKGREGQGREGLWLSEATEQPVTSIEEVGRVLRLGAEARQVAATGMNANSSRSHAVLIASVTRRNAVSGKATTGQLYMVDLAGSENLRRSGAGRLEETGHINRSLFTLGKVIDALLDGRGGHVPYRESKLTRLLQCALGGNARTSLVVTCSMEADDASETLSTLRFGARAAQVVTQPTINEFELPSVLRERLADAQRTIDEQQRAIETLTMQVALLQRALASTGLNCVLPPASILAAAQQLRGSASEDSLREGGMPPLPPCSGGPRTGQLPWEKALDKAVATRSGLPSALLPPPELRAHLSCTDARGCGGRAAASLTSVPADALLLALARLDASSLMSLSGTCHELLSLVSKSGGLWEPCFVAAGGDTAWEAARVEVQSGSPPRSLRQLYVDLRRRQAVAGASTGAAHCHARKQNPTTRLGFRLIGSL